MTETMPPNWPDKMRAWVCVAGFCWLAAVTVGNHLRGEVDVSALWYAFGAGANLMGSLAFYVRWRERR